MPADRSPLPDTSATFASASLPAVLDRPDEEVLAALPAPPKRERTITVLFMALTAIAAAWMAVALAPEARYALAPGQPLEMGELAGVRPGGDLANRYVRAQGMLGTTGAIRYGRAAESDSFRLAPVAGNPSIWVEIRVPEGFEGPRFVPPSTFAGRLVPFGHSGIRHTGLRRTVKEHTGVTVPEDAWLVVDGCSPRASRWAIALVLLFAGFAVWNVFGIVRLLAPVRDRSARGTDSNRA